MKRKIEMIEELVIEHCCNCGITFAFTQDYYQQRQEDGAWFHCPQGHPQHYTKREKLEEKLRAAEQQLKVAQEDAQYWQDEAEIQARHAQTAIREKAAARGQLTKLKKRVANGVCPCCHRQFVNLQRSIQIIHQRRLPRLNRLAPYPIDCLTTVTQGER